MMKKLLLLLASGGFAVSAMAQFSPSSVVRNTREQNGMAPLGEKPSIATKRLSGTANKGTGAHKRVYNYVDYLQINDQNVYDNVVSPPSYFWHKYDMYGVYQGSSALERDTINLASYGFVLHPFWTNFNSSILYPAGTMMIKSTNAYTVDSVYAYGVYGRNPAKTSIVDTLRFAFVYGGGTSPSSQTNIPLYTYGYMANYGDTVNFGGLSWNPATYTLGKPTTSTGPAVVYKDYQLKVGDTSTSAWGAYGVAANFAVPAGQLLGVSVTFKSGENYTPYSDTAFRGSVNTAVPYKYGMFRPMFVNEKETGFPTYTRGNYNSGQFFQYPDDGNGYGSTWGWSRSGGTAASDYQFPVMDFVISCPTCESVSVPNVQNATVGVAFPNPANNTVSLPITMKESANVNVTLSNTVGQILATQNLGMISAKATKNATFSTSSIANGVYFLTVESNGGRSTSRFVVAH